jgi:hypothetical protein
LPPNTFAGLDVTSVEVEAQARIEQYNAAKKAQYGVPNKEESAKSDTPSEAGSTESTGEENEAVQVTEVEASGSVVAAEGAEEDAEEGDVKDDAEPVEEVSAEVEEAEVEEVMDVDAENAEDDGEAGGWQTEGEEEPEEEEEKEEVPPRKSSKKAPSASKKSARAKSSRSSLKPRSKSTPAMIRTNPDEASSNPAPGSNYGTAPSSPVDSVKSKSEDNEDEDDPDYSPSDATADKSGDEKEGGNEEPEHSGQCDGCGCEPIVGSRWRCLE